MVEDREGVVAVTDDCSVELVDDTNEVSLETSRLTVDSAAGEREERMNKGEMREREKEVSKDQYENEKGRSLTCHLCSSSSITFSSRFPTFLTRRDLNLLHNKETQIIIHVTPPPSPSLFPYLCRHTSKFLIK